MANDEAFVRGQITDEGLAKLRRLVGYPNPTLGMPRPGTVPPHNAFADLNTMRHFALGNGDDNPLYTDPEYGKRTRWGQLIASPAYFRTACWDVSWTPSRQLAAETRGALRGVHLFNSGSELTFYRPVVAGNRLTIRRALTGIDSKESTFSGGRSVITHNAEVVANDKNEIVVSGDTWYVHTERQGSAARAKEHTVTLGSYDEAYLAEIDQAYRDEYIRGDDTLYWEDVTDGQQLPPTVKGPLCVRDIIAHHVGAGFGYYNVGALKLDYKNRMRIPAFYGKNEYGAWDTMQRLHWDPAFAQAIGNPNTYDYGPMRFAWMVTLVTNWMGDDAWLYRIRVEHRKFNFVGDTSWARGRVLARELDPVLGPKAELELSITNQRGELTTLGSATVLLASRERGAVRLPSPSDDVLPLVPTQPAPAGL